MGLDTQAVICGHLSVADVCGQLEGRYGATQIEPRPTQRPDYWMIQFLDLDGEHRSIDLFLNSYAIEDYRELTEQDSTLVSMEFGPTSEAVVRVIAGAGQGWVRRHGAEPWAKLKNQA